MARKSISPRESASRISADRVCVDRTAAAFKARQDITPNPYGNRAERRRAARLGITPPREEPREH